MSESARLSKHVPVQLCLRNMDFMRSIKFSRMPTKPDHLEEVFLKPLHVFTAHLNLCSKAFPPLQRGLNQTSHESREGERDPQMF